MKSKRKICFLSLDSNVVCTFHLCVASFQRLTKDTPVHPHSQLLRQASSLLEMHCRNGDDLQGHPLDRFPVHRQEDGAERRRGVMRPTRPESDNLHHSVIIISCYYSALQAPDLKCQHRRICINM